MDTHVKSHDRLWAIMLASGSGHLSSGALAAQNQSNSAGPATLRHGAPTAGLSRHGNRDLSLSHMSRLATLRLPW